jgi:hypothetical protein
MLPSKIRPRRDEYVFEDHLQRALGCGVCHNRSLTALYKAGKRPTKLIDRTETHSSQSPEELASVLLRLEGMAGKPSTEMLVRTEGLGPDGQPKDASDWDAPIGEIVSMPEDLLTEARTCEKEVER